MKNIKFERQDLRRLWLVLGAIEYLETATLGNISKHLGIQMSTLQKVLERIGSEQLPGTELSVSAGEYYVESWGVVDKSAIIQFHEINTCTTLGA